MNATPTTDNQTTPPPVRVIFFGMTGAFSRAPLLALLRARNVTHNADAPPIEVCAVVLPTLAGMATPRLLRPDASEPHPAFVRLDRQTSVGKPRRAPLPTLPMAPPAALASLASLASPSQSSSQPVQNATPLREIAAPGQNILEMATARNIPIFEVARLNDPRTLAALATLAPDVICVACFSRRLPPALLRLPRLGCLNVHPSLLPANRGPDPLFWTFHAGAATTGVTIHLMDERLDTGPIVLQQSLAIPAGIGEGALEAQLATLGGDLLARAVTGLATGALHPRPQDNARASAHPWPTTDDYVIAAEAWSAQRAFRFARGVAARNQPITLVAADGARFLLAEAVGVVEDAPDGTGNSVLREPWDLSSDFLMLRCTPGVLQAIVVPNDGAWDVS